MALYGYQDSARAGGLFGDEHDFQEKPAAQSIDFGAPVFVYEGDTKGYKAHRNKATGLWAGDFVTSNVIVVTVGIDGATPITVDAVNFTSNQATTRTALVAAINANASLVALGVTAAVGTGTRDVVITAAKGTTVTAFTSSITGGTAQEAMTVTYSTTAKFGGVAVLDTSVPLGYYSQYDSISLATCGQVVVPVPSGGSGYINKAAYVIHVPGTDYQKFTDVSTNNYDANAYFTTNPVSGLAVVQIRGLK